MARSGRSGEQEWDSVQHGESRGGTTVNERKSFTGWQEEAVMSKQEKKSTKPQ